MRQGLSPQGIADSVAGPLLFLVLYRTAGLDAALIGAGAAALAILALRVARGQPATTAWYGVAGVAFGVLLAKATGSGEGYFLPKVAGNVFWCVACVVSVVVRRPLVGIAWALFTSRPLEEGWAPGVRRTFSALTLLWAGGNLVRATAYGVLIADDEDRTGSLAVVSVALGLPLTAMLLALTVLTVRRSIGP